MKSTIFIEKKGRTQMIAHRGASCLARENTLPAFRAAGERSYFGMECDIHVTTDGKYVVYHDDETSRLCDRTIVLEQSSFDEVRNLRVKETDGENYDESLIIPALEEYLAVAAKYGKTAIVELKNRMTIEHIGKIAEICKTIHSLGKTVFISFCFENLIDVRKILPEQPVQFLACDYKDETAKLLAEHKMDLDVGWWTLTEQAVGFCHSLGVKVNCWTVDEKQDAERLIGWGVDFITSNTLE